MTGGKVLREARLVRVRPLKQKRFYPVDRKGPAEMAKWLARMGGFWNDKLDRLERALKEANEIG